MAKPLLPDDLWALIEPLIPPPTPSATGAGRPRISDRAALTGILFVLRTGIPWEYLPQEMGCGSGMTCWRRLRDWHRAGVWDQLQRVLLARLHGAECLDWERAVMDASIVRAKGGDPLPKRRPGPTRRTAHAPARSAMSSLTHRASPSRSS